MSFFDTFRKATNTQPQGNQQQNTNQNNQNNNGNNGNNNNSNGNNSGNQQQQSNGMLDGMAGSGDNSNGNSQEAANPLDAFKGMFDNKTTEGDKAPTFSLPQDILDKVSGSQDFLQGVDKELVTKALSGDAQSLMDLIGAATKNSYKASLSHMSTLSDQFVNSRLEHEGKSLSSRVKKELTTTELGNTPSFNHPVVKAQLIQIAESLSKQHPDASAKEIADKAKDYITQMANAINPQANADSNANSAKAGEVNWEDYLNN